MVGAWEVFMYRVGGDSLALNPKGAGDCATFSSI